MDKVDQTSIQAELPSARGLYCVPLRAGWQLQHLWQDTHSSLDLWQSFWVYGSAIEEAGPG